MTAPLVSVIMPCYRQARFLPEALECLFVQSYPAIQPVVINDGSDDDTEAVAAGYRDRISYLHKQNGGPNAARNAGIKLAEGKYLLFLDADDLLHRDAIAVLVEAMQDREDRLCIMGCRSFSQDPAVDGIDKRLLPQNLSLLPPLIYDNLAPIHAYLFSKKMAVSAGGLEESLRQCEDWDFWLRMALRGAEGVSVPLVGAYYRRYPGSNGSDQSRMLRGRVQVVLRAYGQMAANPELLARWGQDLLLSAHRVRRSLIATGGTKEPQYALLGDCIRNLGNHGFRVPRSWGKAVLDTILGKRAEQLTLAYFRHFKPKTFALYCDFDRWRAEDSFVQTNR